MICPPPRIISLAMPIPTNLGRRCVPPQPGITPIKISGWPKTAFSDANRISQDMASSVPPPSAKPLTAAIDGFGMVSISLNVRCPNSMTGTISRDVAFCIRAISAPATNALSPAPVRITALIFSSFSQMVTASRSSVNTSVFRALRTLGLLNVIVAISSSTLKSMSLYSIFSLFLVKMPEYGKSHSGIHIFFINLFFSLILPPAVPCAEPFLPCSWAALYGIPLPSAVCRSPDEPCRIRSFLPPWRSGLLSER